MVYVAEREWDPIRDQVAIDIQILGKQLEEDKITPLQAASDLLDFVRILRITGLGLEE